MLKWSLFLNNILQYFQTTTASQPLLTASNILLPKVVFTDEQTKI